ncbi:MAG: hypothetical protein AB1489_08985 [Acidobacteriota bacterium]
MKKWAERIFIYMIIAVAIIEIINYWGGDMLQRFHLEYAGGGSMKWRSREGEYFQNLLIFAGLWIYPASILETILLSKLALLAKDKREKWLPAIGALVSLIILFRFIYLGIFSAALGIPI